MNGADDTLIEKYGRHIPPILGKQLVLNLINEYLDDRLPINENSSLECVPSLERFHGSMLFVDISGFTVLSQRLNVDELRIHINGYFKKILDLVFKFRGEVIKFAGDALFIVWQTKVTIDDGDAFLMSQREAVAAATACGMEINQTCSNYKISFFQQDLHSSTITSALLVSREDMPTEIQENTKKAAESENFTFLNVHAGVSVGTMAGIDVGANDRWEYLLVGEPLVSVAKAEGEAAVAELVLCPDAHAILHPFDADFMTSGYKLYLNDWQKALDKSEPIPLLPCGCQLTKGKFFKINQTIAGGSNVNGEDAPDPDYELAFYAELIQNVVKAYDDIKPRIYERYDNIVKPNGNDSAELPSIADETAVGVSSSTSSKVVPGLNKEDKLFMHYLRWIQSCVIDDLVRHVHEADRGMITLRGIARKGALLTLARDDLLLSSSGGTEGRGNSKSSLASGGSTPTSVSASSVSVRRRTSDADRVFVSKIRNISQTSSSATRRKMKEHHERTLQQDAALTAELRSVMVLFIKLDVSGSLELFIDPTRSNLALLDPLVNPPSTLSPRVGRLCKEISIESFNFLKRTKAEMEADCKLLSKFQSCMKIMTKIFAERGGQMRQFIVDDKGTVCIGTFGLRGSVNNDNAAAAIETAQDIIDQLVGIGIPSGVGITSGKAYCGLVGSSQRHEYAVMGPSINLSARLMAKSGWGEILCSEDARNRDRTHTFESCGTIVAKGYEHPVPIFKPLVGRGVNLMSPARVRLADVSPRDSPGHPEDSKHSAAASSHKAIISKARASTIGRKEEFQAAFAFLLPSIHSEHPDLFFQTSAEEQRITIAPLDYERPTKLCIVEGGNGIGKSNFIQTFTGHLRNIVRCDRSLNLLVFRNQSSSFNSSEPFCSWKGVLEQMFQSVPNLSTNAGITKRDRFNMGVDLLLESMSAEMVELKPLLSSISYITDLPQTKATNSLTEANRVSKTAVFLAALIQQYCARMKCVVAIMMDDLQSMDSASWQLLKHVFSNNKGLLILGSYRPSNTVSGSTPKSSPTAAASSYVTDMLSFFESSAESCLTVHLDVLDEPSTWLYCQHLMESHNVKGANHTMVSAMRSISGGNPLYLYEIIASFAEKFKLSGSECDLTRQMCSNAFNDMIKSFRSTRIEEVISYRFDQLDPSSQLLLKIASVVCANGSRFTISLMNAVMQDSDDPDDHEGGGNSRIFDLMKNTSGRSDEESAKQPSRETFDIIATVKGLLKRSEFIRTVASGPSSRASRLSSGSGKNRRLSSISTKRAAIVEDADDDMVGFEAMDLTIEDEHEFYGSLEFEFKVNVEQISVYALMLNDQKESLHDRVASYLEKKDFDAKGFNAAPTPSELFEQGFHWEHAANWSAAMVCYYKSAMILEVMGAFEEKFVHLTAAYRMLNAMRRDTGIMEARMEVPASFQLLFSSADNNSNNTGTEGSTSALTPRSLAASAIVRAKESPTLTKELVAKLFYGDSELLETGLQITLKLAQAGFSLSYNYFAYSQLYEEALQIILLTWKINIFEDHLLGNNDGDFKPQISPRGLEPLKVPSTAPHLKRSPSKMSRAMTRAKLTLTSPRNDEFGLTDPTICFPILTGISAMYRFKRLKDDENHSKEATVINLFVALAQTSPAYRMHLVVGYCYKRSICFDQDKIQESIHLTDIARHYYDHDLYSAEVARIYGNDRMPFTMAMNVQILAMLGQHFRAKNYMMHVCELFPRIYHLHSMGITILVLAPLLVQFGMPQQAFEMFQMYVDGVAARGAFSFFHESNPIFLVWLKLEVLFAEFRVTGDVNIFMSDIQSESELSVVASKYLGRAAEQRPVYYSALETFGCGLEMVCSKVCFLRAQMWAATKQRMDQEIYGNLSFALKYINFNIACCEKDSKMAFGYYCALLIKAAILVTITKGMEKKCLYEEEESKNLMLDAKENVLKCLEFGKRLGYTFVCLSAGVVMEQLGIDAEFGLQVQKEYAKMGTMNVSGAALSAAVVKADPSLANEKYFKIGEIRPEDNFNCLTRLFPSLAKFRDEILPQDLREKR